MTRTRFVCVLALALLLAGLLAACSDRGPAEDPAAPAGLAGPAPAKDAYDDSQVYMAWIYAQSHDDPPPENSYTYELAASGTISLATGGSFSGQASSWPRFGRSFSYMMLPNSVDTTSLADPEADSVTVEIWVPVYDTDFPCADADMPVILEPDGLSYKDGMAATIGLSYHPSLTPTCEYQGYHFFEVIQEASGTYSVPNVSDGNASNAVAAKSLAPPPIIRDPIDDVDCRTGIMCAVPHHSRWALSKDDPDSGPGGIDPILPQDPCN